MRGVLLAALLAAACGPVAIAPSACPPCDAWPACGVPACSGAALLQPDGGQLAPDMARDLAPPAPAHAG